MAPRKPPIKTSVSATAKPKRFFEKQLTGEQPPGLTTMKALLELSGEFASREPWTLLSEDQLVMVQTENGDQLCFCSIMGTLGEVFALQVHRGAEGYRFFQRVASGSIHSAGDFYAEHSGVSMEFVPLKELKPPDRELLKSLGYPLKRGALAPLFRAQRPGYHPWYITESEGKLLIECLRAVITLLDAVAERAGDQWWGETGSYPMVIHKPVKGHPHRYEISVEKAPEAPEILPCPPALDEARLNRILMQRMPVKGVLELDHFYASAAIGQANERKACFRTAMAINAETAELYPPQVNLPSASTGSMLMEALLKAIEVMRIVPSAVRVHERAFKILLDSLSAALGFRVEVAESLPVLDLAKKHLLAAIGDAGPLDT